MDNFCNESQYRAAKNFSSVETTLDQVIDLATTNLMKISEDIVRPIWQQVEVSRNILPAYRNISSNK